MREGVRDTAERVIAETINRNIGVALAHPSMKGLWVEPHGQALDVLAVDAAHYHWDGEHMAEALRPLRAALNPEETT